MPDDAKVRAFVAERAGLRCEYCQLPQARTRLLFQRDHVIASKH